MPEQVRNNSSDLLTGFGEIESFFEKVGNQSKQSDESSQNRAYDVEICDRQDRHLAVQGKPRNLARVRESDTDFSDLSDCRCRRGSMCRPGVSECMEV